MGRPMRTLWVRGREESYLWVTVTVWVRLEVFMEILSYPHERRGFLILHRQATQRKGLEWQHHVGLTAPRQAPSVPEPAVAPRGDRSCRCRASGSPQSGADPRAWGATAGAGRTGR